MISKYAHKIVSNLFSDYPTNKVESENIYKFRISIISKNDKYWSAMIEENEYVTLKILPFIDYSIKIENIYPNPEICYILEFLKINGRTIKIIDDCKLYCFDEYLIEGYSKKCPFISVNNTVIEFNLKQWNVANNNGEITLVDSMNVLKIKVKLDTSNV